MVMPATPPPPPIPSVSRTLLAFDPVTGWGHSTHVCDCGCAPTDRPGKLIAGFVGVAAKFGCPNPGGLHYQLVAFDGSAIGVLGSWTPDQARAAIALEVVTPAGGVVGKGGAA